MTNTNHKSPKQRFVDLIHTSLTKSTHFIILRGEKNESDVDLMLAKGYALKAIKILAESGQLFGFKLILVRNAEYVIHLCFVNTENIVEKLQVIKLDIADGLCWRSIGKDLWGHHLLTLSQTNYHQARITCNCIQKYMCTGDEQYLDGTLSYVRKYWDKQREKSILLNQAKADHFQAKNKILTLWKIRLISCFGSISKTNLILFATKLMRAKLVWRQKAKGIVISFSGIDGSGKSTNAKMLLSALESAGYSKCKFFHFLPNWIPSPHQLIKRNSIEESRKAYFTPYSKEVSRKPLSLLRLSYYLICFLVAKIQFKILVAKGYTLILDRSYLDFAVDPERARIKIRNIPTVIHRILFLDGIHFILLPPPEIAIGRKQELTIEKASQLNKSYENLSNHLANINYIRAVNSSEVIESILNRLSMFTLQQVSDD